MIFKWVTSISIVLISIYAIITGYLMYDMFRYINFKIFELVNPFTVYSRTQDGTESKFILIDFFPIADDQPQVYVPRFADVNDLTTMFVSSHMAGNQAERFANESS